MDESEFIKIRRFLHQNPEVSGDENATSQFVVSTMRNIWPEATLEKVGDTGLIFTQGSKEAKAHLAFRCELDALPIQEINDFDYKSNIQGVSHKCGHDGHMTIMLRLADLIANKPPQNVKVSLIFQPSEENGKGAKVICDKSKLFATDKPDHIFSLHNVPGFDLANVVVKTGVFTPSVISVKTKFIGKTSHAAEPQKGNNPAYAIADILTTVKERHVGDMSNENMLIVAPIEIKLGQDSYGVSAGDGMLGFTFRAWSQGTLDTFKNWYESFVAEKCKEAGLRCEFFWFEAFNAVVNESNSTQFIKESAAELGLNVIEKNEPFSWGEDYGLYTERVSGAMFGLGAGKDHPALHNPDYDFPDDLIQPGSDLFYGIIKAFEK